MSARAVVHTARVLRPCACGTQGVGPGWAIAASTRSALARRWAGHSKWANIKHRKGAVDKKRAAIFTKLTKELTAAAKAGGDDRVANHRLALAIEKSKQANLPREKLEAAIARAAGAAHEDDAQEALYEGHGPQGVAVLIDALTENRKRTAPELRHVFRKHGGELGVSGSVSFLFQRKAVLEVVPLPASASAPEARTHTGTGAGAGTDGGAAFLDRVMEVALEAGAEEVEELSAYGEGDAEAETEPSASGAGPSDASSKDDGSAVSSVEVVCDPSDLVGMREALAAAGLEVSRWGVVRHADSHVELEPRRWEAVLDLVDALEELDDVQAVWHNGRPATT